MSLQTRLAAFITAVGADIKGLQQPVISGVLSSNNYYEKYADGRLICRGFTNFPSNANTQQFTLWTYPVAFVNLTGNSTDLPMVTVVASSIVPQNISTGISEESLTSVKIRFMRTTSAATPVYYQAECRWK